MLESFNIEFQRFLPTKQISFIDCTMKNPKKNLMKPNNLDQYNLNNASNFLLFDRFITWSDSTLIFRNEIQRVFSCWTIVIDDYRSKQALDKSQVYIQATVHLGALSTWIASNSCWKVLCDWKKLISRQNSFNWVYRLIFIDKQTMIINFLIR